MRFPLDTPDAAAKCLGSYERELHGQIGQIAASNYPKILNIGCAEGYYAVGLALRCPQASILAHDIDPGMLELCLQLARVNHVDERLQLGGEVSHATLNALQPGTLVLADIEGAERDLLDPDGAPRLRSCDMLVELHDYLVPGTEQLLRDRFTTTHTITAIASEPRTSTDGYPELKALSAPDKLLALFERPVQIHWLVLRATRARTCRDSLLISDHLAQLRGSDGI